MFVFLLTFKVKVQFGSGKTAWNLKYKSTLFSKKVMSLSTFLGSAIKENEGITSRGSKQNCCYDNWKMGPYFLNSV